LGTQSVGIQLAETDAENEVERDHGSKSYILDEHPFMAFG